jgi:hypothetical protein
MFLRNVCDHLQDSMTSQRPGIHNRYPPPTEPEVSPLIATDTNNCGPGKTTRTDNGTSHVSMVTNVGDSPIHQMVPAPSFHFSCLCAHLELKTNGH